ncbi:diguanylate cyclase [Pseudaestuariivita sp.]|uniref:diguanylate cyclase n=1 Tax=Pseudaestuariivita sp. TaxID=2211669 RepID=UPI00405A078A
MPVKIVMADPVPTNRIVWKVRLSAAFYQVVQAATADEVVAATADASADLVLLGPGFDLGACTEVIKRLASDGRDVPIATLRPDCATSDRTALLRAGAGDVLGHGISTDHILARLRALLRAAQADRELSLRDGTCRALGLGDFAPQSARPARIALAGEDTLAVARLASTLKPAMPSALFETDLRTCLLADTGQGAPEAFVVLLAPGRLDEGLGLISNIRARPASRGAAILALAPQSLLDAACRALDHGANDLIPVEVETAELELRLSRLIARKRVADRLRHTVESGLNAAVTDPLTGLFNRRYALPHLQRMAARDAAGGQGFALMILDLDHFKAINDRHGHAAGDAVLKETARRLTENLRAQDLVARIGGEEFLIAMPDTGATAARAAARRLCRQISDQPFVLPGASTGLSVTASIGVSLGTHAARGAPSGIDTLLAEADRALYGAKAHGRNQIHLSRDAA